MLDFDQALQQLSSAEFIQKILKEKINTDALIIGYDHRFGKNRSEGFEDYKRYGESCGIDVILENGFSPEGLHISSSAIRRELIHHNAKKANTLLGRDYMIEGIVIDGYKIGRTIGFPTANICLDNPDKLIPGSGVYAVFVKTAKGIHKGMLNIGVCPTINSDRRQTIEVNLFDFDEDLYGQSLRIYFHDYIREERKMESVEDLIRQLQEDREKAIALLNYEFMDQL